MEEYNTILLEKKEGMGVITLKFADILNAIEVRIKDELLCALKSFAEDEEVQIVVFNTGGIGSASAEFLRALNIFDGNFWSDSGVSSTKSFVAL